MNLMCLQIRILCLFVYLEVADNFLVEEQRVVESSVDYSSETDDKSIIIDFVKSIDESALSRLSFYFKISHVYQRKDQMYMP